MCWVGSVILSFLCLQGQPGLIPRLKNKRPHCSTRFWIFTRNFLLPSRAINCFISGSASTTTRHQACETQQRSVPAKTALCFRNKMYYGDAIVPLNPTSDPGLVVSGAFCKEIKAQREKYLVGTQLRNTGLCIQGDSNGISNQQLAMGKQQHLQMISSGLI